jgi:hypothetical protein
MTIELSQPQILRVLSWAAGCDDEGFIDERDWPLVQSLAESININPYSVVPSFAKEIDGADPYADYRFDREWAKHD